MVTMVTKVTRPSPRFRRRGGAPAKEKITKVTRPGSGTKFVQVVHFRRRELQQPAVIRGLQRGAERRDRALARGPPASPFGGIVRLSTHLNSC